MKNAFFTLLLLILSACADKMPDRVLVIDMNGTTENAIRVFSKQTGGVADTVAIGPDERYIVDMTDWECGFYTLDIDSQNQLDIVVCDTMRMFVNARRNHLAESTTNSTATQALWRLQAVLAAMNAQIDSVNANAALTQKAKTDSVMQIYAGARSCTDKLLEQSEISITVIPILNAGRGTQKLYNILADYDIFAEYSRRLSVEHGENKAVADLAKLVSEAQSAAAFMRRNKVGQKAPVYRLRKLDGTTVDTSVSPNLPYIYYCSSDTVSQALAIQRLTGWYRMEVGSVFVAEPNPEDLPPKFNLYVGRPADVVDEKTLSLLSPILMQVGADGVIKRFIVRATLADVNSVL